MAGAADITAPTKGDMKQIFATGKVALADMIGDAAILNAMKTNEDETVAAYERAPRHEEARPEPKAFFMKAHLDEERHRAWISTMAGTL